MRQITLREALREAMAEEMRRDENLFLIGTDVGPYGGEFRVSGDLHSEFGDYRVQDAPISEQGIVGCAIGASMTGCRAIAEIPFNDFIAMPMDQIVNQAAKFCYMFGGQTSVPIVIRSALGGYLRAAGQHSQSLEVWLAHIPGLKVVMPSSNYDAKGLLKSAIRDKNPVIFLEHKFLYSVKEEVPEEEYVIPLGVGEVKKKGTDITVVATSYMVHKSMSVAKKLEKEDISVEIIDPRTLVPLDKDMILNSVKKTGKLLTVQEACRRCGYLNEIISIVADEGFDYLKKPIKRIGSKEAPIPFRGILEDYILPSEEEIENTIRELLQ